MLILEDKLLAKVNKPLPEWFFTKCGGGGETIWAVNDKIALGLFGAGGGAEKKKEVSSSVYERISVGFGTFQGLLSYKPIISKKWIIATKFGLGYFGGGYTIKKTDDTNEKTWERSWDGTTFGGMCQLDLRYKLNKVLSGGVTLGYISAKIDDLERCESEKDDLNAYKLDLSGPYFGMIWGVRF
ncbi:MAG: hypothetical protein QMD92_06040 [bacterium]|nr:hypothetical protein [bacterium]